MMISNSYRFLRAIICASFLVGLSGCSAFHQDGALWGLSARKGAKIANIAKQFLGTPYVYGGRSSSGFDCSGLVQYSYRKAGIEVPRTAASQFETAQSVPVSEMMPGDVIFFRLGLWKVSHVGIYVGKGKFIHSPRQGKKVSYASLYNPYWRDHVEKIGRFYHIE